MKKLEELKKGDRINIEFAWNVEKAKVLANDTENNKIYLGIYSNPISWFFGCHKMVFSYDDCIFKNFNILNNA